MTKTLGIGRWALAGLAACAVHAFVGDAAAQTLRVTVDQPGDFDMIGNTLGYDCSNVGAAPTVGTVPGAAACGLNTIDTAPDVFWRSDDMNGTASASTANSAATARSTAVLNLPSGATVTHAFLYWGGETTGLANVVDPTVTFERPDGSGGTVFSSQVTAQAADQYGLLVNTESYFQAVADVSTLVNTHGSGAYRVGDLALRALNDYAMEITYASWTLVVFYTDPSEPPRNLTLFDGLTIVGNQSATATLSGFLVPNAGFDAKLGVIAYEGDEFFTGDSLLFGEGTLDPVADALSNANNPFDNFFNSSRTYLGVGDSNSGDLPQLAGTPDTMGSVDFDVIDITDRVTGGQTSAEIEATTSGDVYFLGAFVTSISTYEPNLNTSTKDVVDVDGEPLLVGDEVEYTITVVNTGNDNAINTVMSDPLPAGVSYVPGSLEIVSGPNTGPLTDASGDDQGEYDSGTRTVTVRLGDGADAASGGQIDIAETTVVRFLVTVDAGTMGTISNQAEITYEGEQGAPVTVVPTDGNGPDVGTPSTDIDVNECDEDIDCGGANNGQVCDTDDGYVCVPGCRGTGMDSGCPNGFLCTSMDDTIGECIPDGLSGSGGAGGGMASAAGGMTSASGGAMSGGAMSGGAGGGMSGGVGGAGGSSGVSTNVGGAGGLQNGYFDDGNINQSGSCGCAVPGEDNELPWRSASLLALAAALGLRRRRR